MRLRSRVVTFGEVMGRVTPPGLLRFSQAVPGPLELTFGGAEVNVAAAIAFLGGEASFVTALPRNGLADACVRHLRGIGIDTRHVLRTDDGRLGLYFLETGANQRGGSVLYDRDGSSMMRAPADAYDWPSVFEGAAWFHVTGITPSLSAGAADATRQAVLAARAAGATVSCDLNYRKKLWTWRPGTRPRDLAEETMRALLPSVDLVVANEEDAAMVLGIHAAGTDVEAGRLDVEAYRSVASEIAAQFPNVWRVAITLRESVSASHNNWGAMLYEVPTQVARFAPLDADGAYRPYEIRDIVDRVGAGDSFAGALIYALLTDGLSDTATALRFATAASCLKHSVWGDFSHVSRGEVEALMAGDATGRVRR